MKLYEIIAANDNPKLSINYEKVHPYKKSLFTYYSAYFPKNSEPTLVFLSVSNAVSYCKIVPSTEIIETIQDYLEDYDCSNPENENFGSYEQILSDCKLLSDII